MFDLPFEILIAVGGIIAAVISFIAGGRNEKSKADAKRAETDLDAIIKRRELEDEVEKLGPDDRRKRLDKWVLKGE